VGSAAAGGMADVNGIAKIEMFDDSRDIGCVVIHIVPVAHLARTTVTAAIMRDDAITLADEEEHLRIPVVGTKWPAVMKDDRLGGLRAPILVEDLDAILGRDGGHGVVPFGKVLRKFCFLACRR